MKKIKNWIHAFRLRTLPLAISSIIMGGFLSAWDNQFSWLIILLAVLTTLFLQILSNLANDYGDYKAGTDNHERIGPERSVQSGNISAFEMKIAILTFIFFSLSSGSALIYFGTEGISLSIFYIFFGLGILAILAAVNYTMGKNPYGYKGFGDLFVLIFFGFAGVCGTYYLNTHLLNWTILLPAFSIGLLSMAVLNLNNMRDIDNDLKSGKITLVVKMGSKNAMTYHMIIISASLVIGTLFMLINYNSYLQFFYLITFPLFIKDMIELRKIEDPSLFDPYLKKQAIHTLLYSIAFGASLLL